MDVLPINHIERKPDTGQPCIARTGVTVAGLIATLENNPDWTVQRVAEELSLTVGQVYAALSYYSDHRAEIKVIWARGEAAARASKPSPLDAKSRPITRKGRIVAARKGQRRWERIKPQLESSDSE